MSQFVFWDTERIRLSYFPQQAGRGLLSLNFAVLSLKKEKPDMLSWSITFLIIGLIAGVLGLSGVAGAATQIAWILFVVFLVLFLVSLIMGRRPPV